MADQPKSLASNTAWSAVASLIATACRMSIGIFLAHYYSIEMNGSYLLFGWFAEFLTLLICLGLPAVLNRYPALENKKGNLSVVNSIIQWAWKRTIFSGLLISVIYFFVLKYWGTTKHFNETTLILAATLLFTQSLSAIANACLTGLQLFKALAINNLLMGMSLVILQSTGAYLYGIDGALAGFILANLISVILIIFKIKVHFNSNKIFTKYNFSEVKSYALHSGIAAVISAIVWSRCEIFFLNQFSTPTQASYFGVAMSLVSALSLGVTMLTGALTPHFSASMATVMACRQLQRDYTLLTLLTALFCIPISIFASALMPILMPIIFGHKYIDATIVAQLLILSAGLGFANVGSILQYASGNSRFIMMTSLLGAVLMLTGLYFTIGLYGALGAATIRLAVQILMISIGTRFNTRKLKISFPIKQLLIIVLISCLVASPAYYLASINEPLYCVGYLPFAVIAWVVILKKIHLFTMHQSVRIYKIFKKLANGNQQGDLLNNYLLLSK